MTVKKVIVKDEIPQVESGVQLRSNTPEESEENQLWYQDDTKELKIKDTTEKLLSDSYVQSEKDYNPIIDYDLIIEDNPTKYINTISGANNWIYDFEFLADGSVVAVGEFSTFGGVTRNRFVKLNKDGTEDSVFYEDVTTGGIFNNTIVGVNKTNDGNLLFTGSFTSVKGLTRNYIIKIREDGSEDLDFYSNLGLGFNNSITLNSVLVLRSGKILIGGNFTSFDGDTRNRLVCLNPDGTRDTSFTASLGTGLNNYPTNMIELSDGRILISGLFTTFKGNTRNRLICLAPNGNEHVDFYENIGKVVEGGGVSTAFNDGVHGLFELNNEIYVTGNFTTVNGVSRNRIVKLKSNGLIDTDFQSEVGTSFNNFVREITYIPAEDCFAITGTFTSFNGLTANRILFLNPDGSINFKNQKAMGSGYGGETLGLTFDGRSRLCIGGNYTSFNGATRNRITFIENVAGPQLRWNDGFVYSRNIETSGENLDLDIISIEEDSDFYSNIGTGFSGSTEVIKRQSDGKILIAGNFTSFNGSNRYRLVRIDEDGSDDSLFNPVLGNGFNASVKDVAIQSDGKILVCGLFSIFNLNTRNRLVRLNSNGTEDTAFYTNLGSAFGGTVRNTHLLSDGRIVVTGDFTTFNGNTRNRIVCLNSDGTENSDFQTNINSASNGPIYASDIDDNERIIISGDFSSFNGSTVSKVARLNSDGTLDTTFNSNIGTGFSVAGQFPFAVKKHRDGYILGGNFTTYNGNSRIRLIRLKEDGTEDSIFYSNLGNSFNDTIEFLSVSSDDKIFVGGFFITFNTKPCKYVVRLNPNGTEDYKFNASLRKYSANYTTIEANSKVANVLAYDDYYILTGDFTNFDSLSRNRIYKLKEVVDESALDKAIYISLSAPEFDTEVFVQTSIQG